LDVQTAIQLAQSATIDKAPQVARARAYQSVTQSGAIAIQDATDYLRNMMTIASTATGVGVAQLVAGNANGAKVLAAVATIVPEATANFSAVGMASSAVVTAFPSS